MTDNVSGFASPKSGTDPQRKAGPMLPDAPSTNLMGPVFLNGLGAIPNPSSQGQ
jgi:hypothetical protein